MSKEKTEFLVRAVCDNIHHSFSRNNIDEAKSLIKELDYDLRYKWTDIKLFQLTRVDIKALLKSKKLKQGI